MVVQNGSDFQLSLLTKSQGVTIHMKVIKEYFFVVVFEFNFFLW